MSPKQKVYQEVLHEIRKYIDIHNLEPGDKLPSERELSEKLNAGRSSIREALRAIELLGLIETRHGEGTFLSTYRPYQTVELLASFILQESEIRDDLSSAKKLLEKEAAKLAFDRLTEKEISELRALAGNSSMEIAKKHIAFFGYLFEKTDNLLLVKIWQLMEDFSGIVNRLYYDDSFYLELASLFSTNKYELIEPLFTKHFN